MQVRCEIDGVEQHIVKDDKDKVMWSVKILSRNTDVLTTKVGDTIKTKRAKEVHFFSYKHVIYFWKTYWQIPYFTL